MLACLNVPAEKLAKRAIDSAAQRIITMREVLGDGLPDLEAIYGGLVAGFAEGLGIAPQGGPVTAYEEALAERALREEIGTDAFVTMLDAPPADNTLVSASLTGRGGTVRADIRLEGPHGDRIREALITGDFFITPPRIVFDLEASLRGLPVTEAGLAVENFFARNPTDFLSLSAGDFVQVVEMALRQRGVTAVAS